MILVVFIVACLAYAARPSYDLEAKDPRAFDVGARIVIWAWIAWAIAVVAMSAGITIVAISRG